ncbi:DEAD/DEAH box helicase [Acinetobacter courvalinii]|uniref:DEAD/DEAH box helicase n=1 Tax=Acinetobacter courvalinii TaxID=280147 RepID=UPI003F553DAE
MTYAFQKLSANIENNPKLREPQINSYLALKSFYKNEFKSAVNKEVGIVLPVGCGKSGCITITPFAFESKRSLVIAPGVSIANQLLKDFEPLTSFYKKCSILKGNEFPEPVEIRSKETNLSDLEESDVVITNIQQLQGENNRWLNNLPNDFFDVIIFDEGHHSVAETWENLKNKFSQAAIVNYSATPERSDGQIMAGKVIYTFPVQTAIQKGYVKELTAVRLNPKTLKYVRYEDNREVEVTLEEVIKLGEEDASFRRSIVTSKETLDTIVDASIQQLLELRRANNDNRLKIIASALNYEHCIQVVQAYRERGFSADYVHTRENSKKNNAVLKKLNSHELDVIVQVRKLTEGFDHPYLSVAAVFSVFANLSPFIQFVGRIMRVIEQDSPRSMINQGVVIYHAGSNIANRWADFKEFSSADKAYFDQLLPEKEFNPADYTNSEILKPRIENSEKVDIMAQSDVSMDTSTLIDDPKAIEALRYLQKAGVSGNIEELLHALELERVPVTKVKKRQAQRQALHEKVQNATGKILGILGKNPVSKNLDRSFRQNNYEFVCSLLNRHINQHVKRSSDERHEFTAHELNSIESAFDHIVLKVEQELTANEH